MIDDLEERVREVHTAPYLGPVIHPLVEREELERSSPLPFHGRPDRIHPELDLDDPLYVPRYLIRTWGWDRFVDSPYYLLWESEAGRQAKKFEQDLKASERKGKR